MLNSLSIHNIENFKLDIIYYIASIVYKTWWTLEHYKPKYYEVADIYNISVLVLADFKHDANEEDVRKIITDSAYCSLLKFKDEKAIRYIKITYLLYNNIRDLPWNLSDKICKIIREGKYECQK